MGVVCGLCLVRKMERVSNGWAGVFRLRRAGLFVPPSQEYTISRSDSRRPTTTDEGQARPTKGFLARGEPDRSLFGQTMHVIIVELNNSRIHLSASHKHNYIKRPCPISPSCLSNNASFPPHPYGLMVYPTQRVIS